jgi:hypothetical protein
MMNKIDKILGWLLISSYAGLFIVVPVCLYKGWFDFIILYVSIIVGYFIILMFLWIIIKEK